MRAGYSFSMPAARNEADDVASQHAPPAPSRGSEASMVARLLPECTNHNDQGTDSGEKDQSRLRSVRQHGCHYLGFAELSLLRPHFIDARADLIGQVSHAATTASKRLLRRRQLQHPRGFAMTPGVGTFGSPLPVARSRPSPGVSVRQPWRSARVP